MLAVISSALGFRCLLFLYFYFSVLSKVSTMNISAFYEKNIILLLDLMSLVSFVLLVLLYSFVLPIYITLVFINNLALYTV